MQALIDRANQVGHYMPQDQNQNWEYKLFSPLKEQHLAHEQSTENDSTYPFKYMAWVRKQNIVSSEETDDNNSNIINITDNNNNSEDTLVPLDLTQFDRSKYTTNNNGLSADDIRGAVGGSESIPGLSSSSDANTNKNNTTNGNTQQPEEKITHITDTPVVETPAPVVEETSNVETPIIEETPGVADSTITQSPIVETPLSDTPVTEASVAETPVIETVETTTTTVENNAVDTPAEETPSVQPAVQESTAEPIPESEDIEMKD